MPITMPVAATTPLSLAIPVAGAAASHGHGCCRDDGGLDFLPFCNANILGNFIDVLRILHGTLILPLLHRHSEFLLDLLAVYRPGVVGAKGVYQAIGGRIVN